MEEAGADHVDRGWVGGFLVTLPEKRVHETIALLTQKPAPMGTMLEQVLENQLILLVAASAAVKWEDLE